MITYLLFAGKKQFPEGGARDFMGVLEQHAFPSDVELCNLFVGKAEQENWQADDYWINVLPMVNGNTLRPVEFDVFIRKEGDTVLPAGSAYITCQWAMPASDKLYLVPQDPARWKHLVG